MSTGLESLIVCFEQEKDCRVVGTGGGRIEWGRLLLTKFMFYVCGLGIISDRSWDVQRQQSGLWSHHGRRPCSFARAL
jgi:hypothetical protein